LFGSKKVKAIALLVILATFIVFVGMDFLNVLGYRTLVYGSTGTDVKTLQSKLKKLGYHNGKVDGIYGWRTSKSVKWFQSRFGLKVDGVVGPATWAALNKAVPGIPTVQKGGTTASGNAVILAKMITGEARGEPYIGQVAVAAVILNRVRSNKFPDSVYSVCFQPGAFDAIRDGQYFRAPTSTSLKAAKAALNGYDPTYGALFYWNPATATSRWIWSRKITLRIGKHVFGI